MSNFPADADVTTTASATATAIAEHAASHTTTSSATADANVDSPAAASGATTAAPAVVANVDSPGAATATVTAAATATATAPSVITGSRTGIPPQTATLDGVGAVWTQADPFNGMFFPNRGASIVRLRNTGVADGTATFWRADGSTLPISIPAGADMHFPVWPMRDWNQSDGTVRVDFASSGNVSIAAVEVYPRW